ncbi:MAG: hypothetical protein HOP08_20510 [Cyclobacteriaceae bacterium]|nr:hypothetical protein [Cyclobacteriaceae bacterium]
MKNEKIEVVIVFKKGVSEARSEEILKDLSIDFREGMDSSRGKIYFYATGGKYILTFKDAGEKELFDKKRLYFLPEVHEIYKPDWDITKD